MREFYSRSILNSLLCKSGIRNRSEGAVCWNNRIFLILCGDDEPDVVEEDNDDENLKPPKTSDTRLLLIIDVDGRCGDVGGDEALYGTDDRCDIDIDDSRPLFVSAVVVVAAIYS